MERFVKNMRFTEFELLADLLGARVVYSLYTVGDSQIRVGHIYIDVVQHDSQIVGFVCDNVSLWVRCR